MSAQAASASAGVAPPLGWAGIVRLGLVQTSLGAIVVLMMSTINRVMVVELALPAMVPGALVGLHYAVQVLRPRWGYGSDVGGRRTPWILAGMALLAAGGVGAALATALAANHPVLGLSLAVLAFVVIGIGVGAAGTSLLVLLATRVEPRRRGAAATIVWIMMIAGFAVTAPLAGHFLDPFSAGRLVAVTSVVAAAALAVSVVAVRGVEGAGRSMPASPQRRAPPHFRTALREVWSEPEARRFTVFIFVTMLAYSAQELILEPFAGLVFGMSPGSTTTLAGIQHAGVLAGMVLVALVTATLRDALLGNVRSWMIAGCLASGAALAAIGASPAIGSAFPLRAAVFALGVGNGAFAVAAIGSMMGLAGAGGSSREGTRMGLWGASQAIAFGLGGFAGTAAVDLSRHLVAAPEAAYAIVFLGEGLLFVVGAVMAARLSLRVARRADARAGADAAMFAAAASPGHRGA